MDIKWALCMWHLALCHVLGLPMKTKWTRSLSLHAGQESEIINNMISEGVTKEINRVTGQRELGRGAASLGYLERSPGGSTI